MIFTDNTDVLDPCEVGNNLLLLGYEYVIVCYCLCQGAGMNVIVT